MSDEVLEACLNNFRDYNLKSYLVMRERLSALSSQLCAVEHSPFWTMENVGKALWTAAVISTHTKRQTKQSQVLSVSGTKRSREVDAFVDSSSSSEVKEDQVKVSVATSGEDQVSSIGRADDYDDSKGKESKENVTASTGRLLRSRRDRISKTDS
jgi:hypothetical protein